MTSSAAGSGTAADPWILTTPPGKSEFEAWRDEDSEPPALVVQVGTTQLRYYLRCIDDLHTMLKERGDWVPLGTALTRLPAGPGHPGRTASPVFEMYYQMGNFVPWREAAWALIAERADVLAARCAEEAGRDGAPEAAGAAAQAAVGICAQLRGAR